MLSIRLQNLAFTAIWLFLALCFTGCSNQNSLLEQPKPRIVVTCDPELDDANSLIRFLLYSTDYQVEGLIYASSQFHWKGDGKGTKWFVPGREYTRFGLNMGPMESWRWAKDERFIHDAVETYEKVYANLKIHNPDYPSPEELKSKIRYGNIEFDGDISKDTPGSDLIKSLILDDIPGPLYITAWGGQSTIARALKSIQMQYETTPEWEDVKVKVSKKVIILPSGDQDDTYAKYIKPNWPEIGYSQLSGAVRLSYNAQAGAKPGNAFYYTPEWMQMNISSKGPFGALYRVWGDGKQMVKGDIFDYFGFPETDEELRKKGYIVWAPVQPKGSWLGEGDTPTFLNLIDNGLRAFEDDTYGGWGGRKRLDQAEWNGSFDSTISLLASMSRDTVLPDFFPAVQNDFAARFHWSVTPEFDDANHEPVLSLNGPLSISARPGEKIRLKGAASDPDGDSISINWWHFKTGSYKGDVRIADPSAIVTEVILPDDVVAGQTIHLILEATDNGSPALTRYRRVIVTIAD